VQESLIDMLGTVFLNRQIEAEARAEKDPEYKKAKNDFDDAFEALSKYDKDMTFQFESAANALQVNHASEAYMLGIRDGVAIAQTILQDNQEPFLVLAKRARKVVASKFHLHYGDRPFGLEKYEEMYALSNESEGENA